MFHNYFFLKYLVSELKKEIEGLTLLACFSQNKNELILIFGDHKKKFHIKANLDPSISLLSFPKEFTRARKNSIDIFSELLHKKVTEVSIFQYERSFQVQFGNDSVIFKLHARRANILYMRGDTAINIFRKSLKQDFKILASTLHKKIILTKENFISHGRNPMTLIPALGKEVKIYLENRGFYKQGDQEKWRSFENLLKSLAQNPIYLHEDPQISLLCPSDEATRSAINATNWLYNATVKKVYLENKKIKAIDKLKQKINASRNYVAKTNTKLWQIENKNDFTKMANIIMANLHSLNTGLSKAVLYDFYSNEFIEIKLNRQLSPQKNAEKFYKKAKNQYREIEILKRNIVAKEKLMTELSLQISLFREVNEVKKLKKYLEEYKLLEKVKPGEKKFPYRQFEIEGWKILLGTNAKTNDELTFKIAKKNDLWLHAKDVTGSHVVIKQKPGYNFPYHIIEKAASLVAINSKRKNDSLCPVICTQKKFVRKAKGSPAGQVIVEKEEILLVEPSNIDSQS